MSKQPRCPYCNRKPELVSGERIYPKRRDLHELKFYLCTTCGAYVGCHPGSNRPLGRLADAELRRWKQNAHKVLDPLWTRGRMRRSQAYSYLADRMGISKRDCHIGMFDVEQCQQAVRILSETRPIVVRQEAI